MNLPTLPSMESISDQIQKEEENKINCIEANEKNILNLWDEFEHNSQNNVLKSVMQNCILSYNNLEITARVGTSIARDTLLDTKEILEYLRVKTGESDLYLSIEIDRSLAPDMEDLRPKTKEEIWKIMVEKNPNLETMRKKLNLKMKP